MMLGSKQFTETQSSKLLISENLSSHNLGTGTLENVVHNVNTD